MVIFRQTYLNPVLKHSDRRIVVLNARERVACYRRKSREPGIGKRKGIGRVEVIGAHIRWGPILVLKFGSVW